MLSIPDPGSPGEAMLVEASGWVPSRHPLQCLSAAVAPKQDPRGSAPLPRAPSTCGFILFLIPLFDLLWLLSQILL